MIRINLANAIRATGGGVTEASGDAEGASDIQRQGLSRLLIILIVPLALYAYESFVLLPDLQSRLASKTNLHETLLADNERSKSALEEKKKFEEDQDRLKKQIGAIDGLSSDRMKEVKILDTIQRDIPEKVWLTNISVKDDQVMITGNANSDADLTAFMDSLSRSIYIKEVNLVKSSEMQSVNSGSLLKRFDIACVINRAINPGMSGGQR